MSRVGDYGVGRGNYLHDVDGPLGPQSLGESGFRLSQIGGVGRAGSLSYVRSDCAYLPRCILPEQ